MLWLRERKPDIVGFQELKLEDKNFPADAFEAAGYHSAAFGQKSWNGVAILSRTPIEVTQRGLPGQEAFGSRLISARIENIDFTTVYVPNGKTIEHDDFPRKLAWYDSLLEYFESEHRSLDAHILCGDFNVCPAALDTWNEREFQGSIFHTTEERERVQKLLRWGFTDVFRKLYPDEQVFSWWDYRGGAFHKKQGLRIDFLLATEALAGRIKDVQVDRDYRKKKEELKASDHAPVILDLE